MRQDSLFPLPLPPVVVAGSSTSTINATSPAISSTSAATASTSTSSTSISSTTSTTSYSTTTSRTTHKYCYIFNWHQLCGKTRNVKRACIHEFI